MLQQRNRVGIEFLWLSRGIIRIERLDPHGHVQPDGFADVVANAPEFTCHVHSVLVSRFTVTSYQSPSKNSDILGRNAMVITTITLNLHL